MILLVGNNKDDLLYFDTRMNNKKEDVILNKYNITIGEIYGQAVILLRDVYTNIVSSTIVSYLIDKYFVLFVIKIGRCLSLEKNLKNGDIVLSTKVLTTDIDITDVQGTKLGQIPGYTNEFIPSYDLRDMIENSFAKFSFNILKSCVTLSSNKHYTSKDEIADMLHNDQILTEDLNNVVLDSESYGIGLACSLHDVPFATIDVVMTQLGQPFTPANYIKVLKQYTIVGKTISNVIGELGNNEVIGN